MQRNDIRRKSCLLQYAYAIMHHCSLAGANLLGCCFEHVFDLSHANLQSPQLVCVKINCSQSAFLQS